MCVLEHYFSSKSFVAVREAFSNAYSGSGVSNNTTGHRLVTKFRDTGTVCDRKYVRRRTLSPGETFRFFARDGAMGHTANTTALLQEFIAERIVRCSHWQPRSPDLSLQNSFCLDLLKNELIRMAHEARRS
jgi:hypothetical protein